MSKDYDYETATEAERWAYDQGYEAGWDERLNPATMSIEDIKDALRAGIACLERMRDEMTTETPTRGRIEFEGAVIPLPDEQEENR